MSTEWNAWIGRSETSRDTVTPAMAEALAATIGTTADLRPGAPAPAGTHWLLAPPRAPMAELGEDGHPARGGFLPPVDLPRRMWAATALAFHAPLRIGDTVERRSTVASIDEKAGASGRLVFVAVDREYGVGGAPRISERQTVVYRDIQPHAAPPPAVEAAADFERRLVPDPVMLFRYSAVTFNGHRIHYDLPYAKERELYPGLVIHGPLVATLCLDLAARHIGPDRLATFTYRGVSPGFAGEELRIAATRDGDGLTFAASAAGRIVAKAAARIA